MDQNIVLSLIGIVPAIIASIVTYGVSAKKTKVDMIKLINDSSAKLRVEVKLELEECRKDREAIRSELNVYKKENESIKKELEEQKKENSQLKRDLNEFEIKLDAANDLISKLVDSKVSKKKLTK
jgi:septal ring factor EnvC (AmiA/AmiB activator)